MKFIKGFFRFLLVIAALALIGAELYLHGAFDFYEKLDTISSKEDLCDYTIGALSEGKDEFKIYTKNITESDIKHINSDISSFYGTVESYTIINEKSDGTKKIKVELKVSENQNVYKALVEKDDSISLTEREQAVYDKAKTVLSEIIKKGMSDYDKEEAIHDYIVKNCIYQKGSEGTKAGSDIYTPYGVLIDGAAVCNGYAETMYLLLNACGIESQVVVGKADGENHAWNIVKIDGVWYQLDTTWDDPVPDQVENVQYTFFNLPDEAMAKTHTWANDRYPECKDASNTYFKKHKLVCKDYTSFIKKANKAIDKKKEYISLMVPKYNEDEYNLSFVMDSHPEIAKASYSTVDSSMGTVINLMITYSE
ncbi:MAG: hypothetical protein II699_02555 [Lachnospiraceae bacterium]|nr:hypothetical protein [Lachnospiraceae bacterium]